MNRVDLAEIQRQILATLASQAPATQRNWLEQRLRASAGERDFTRAVLLVQSVARDAFASYKVGLGRLREARRILTQLAVSDRRMRRYERQMQVVCGNFLARYKDGDGALQVYQLALVGERDPEQVAIIHLNMARVHLAEGSLAEALRIAATILPSHLEGSLAGRISLLRARVYATLGDEDKAATALTTAVAEGQNLAHDVEWRYLRFMVDLDYQAQSTDEQAQNDFAEWLTQEGSERAQLFYRTELLAYDVIAGRGPANSRARLARSRQFAQVASIGIYHELVKHVTAKHAPTRVNRIRRVLARLQREGSQLSFRYISLLLAGRALQHAQPADALILLNDLRAAREIWRAGLPTTVGVLEATDSRALAVEERLRARVPKYLRQRTDLASQRILDDE